jgi:hypothetical protein
MYAFFTGSTLRVEPESSDLFLKIVSVSVRVANLTIPSTKSGTKTESTYSSTAVRVPRYPTGIDGSVSGSVPYSNIQYRRDY